MLITVCGLQQLQSLDWGLTTTNLGSDATRGLGTAEKEKDDLLYRHFWSEGHNGLSDMSIQLIDRVNGEEQLREKEGQWAYRLNTLDPHGLNDNDFFFIQNRRPRRTWIVVK